MPKITTEFYSVLNIRVKSSLKNDLLEINDEYAKPAREAMEQYIPIKKLLLNPLALSRVIDKEHSKLEFSANKEGSFQLSLNGVPIEMNNEDLKVLMANVFLHTLSTQEV